MALSPEDKKDVKNAYGKAVANKIAGATRDYKQSVPSGVNVTKGTKRGIYQGEKGGGDWLGKHRRSFGVDVKEGAKTRRDNEYDKNFKRVEGQFLRREAEKLEKKGNTGSLTFIKNI